MVIGKFHGVLGEFMPFEIVHLKKTPNIAQDIGQKTLVDHPQLKEQTSQFLCKLVILYTIFTSYSS